MKEHNRQIMLGLENRENNNNNSSNLNKIIFVLIYSLLSL